MQPRFLALGNKLFNPASIAYANLTIPTEDEEDSWVELLLCFHGGGSTVLYQDAALVTWAALQELPKYTLSAADEAAEAVNEAVKNLVVCGD